MINNLFDNQRYPLEAKLEREEEAVKTRHDPVACFAAMKRGARCWASFTNEFVNGRDLFRHENQARIKALAAETEGGNSGGSFSAALKILWDKADQEEWNARDMARRDVHKKVASI